MSTLIVYPEASGGSTTGDGRVAVDAADSTFSTIRAAAGTVANNDFDIASSAQLIASTTTDQYSDLRRSIYTFDTSPLTSGVTISSAVFSIYGSSKTNGLGDADYHVCASTPAANNTFVAADYGQLGSTSFASIVYSSFSTSAYNDFTLDSNGIANVSKTGISKFGSRISWDMNNSFTGTWSSSADSRFVTYYSDATGTANDPKLTITYSTTVANYNFFLFF